MRLILKNLKYCLIIFVLLSCGNKKHNETNLQNNKTSSCTNEYYQNNEFSISKPSSWSIVYTGSCSNFAFATFDSVHPDTRAFFLYNLGPVYLNLQKKRSDLALIKSYGLHIPHFSMPVVNPFTPSNFLKNFSLILETQVCNKYINICPSFKNAIIINSSKIESSIPAMETEVIRVVFSSYNKILEGLVMISTMPELSSEGENNSGLGYAYIITGMCAPPEHFEENLDCFFDILKSFHIDEQVYRECINGKTYLDAQIAKSGKWLGNNVSAIKSAWASRSNDDDKTMLYYVDSLTQEIMK